MMVIEFKDEESTKMALEQMDDAYSNIQYGIRESLRLAQLFAKLFHWAEKERW